MNGGMIECIDGQMGELLGFHGQYVVYSRDLSVVP